YALLGEAGAAREGSFLSLDELRACWRSGDALLSPSLAAFVSLGGAPGFERECWEVSEGVFMFPMRTPTILPATHTNAFLVAGNSAVVIEPASPDAAELQRFVAMIEQERARLGFSLREIL